MLELPFVNRAHSFADRIAFRTAGATHTYRQLLNQSATIAENLLSGASDLEEARVGLLANPGFGYSSAQWAIWRAGGIAVPLCLSATEPEWEYALLDSQTTTVLTDASNRAKIAPLCTRIGVRIVELDSLAGELKTPLPTIESHRQAMILYTSGTTSKPKGVVTTHANIQAQIESLIEAWQWSADDSIPMFLPLHHIHGIINIVGCALWSGAVVEPFSRFDLLAIFERVRADAYTLFMAVPTIYVKLIQGLEASNDSGSRGCHRWIQKHASHGERQRGAGGKYS